MSAESYQHHKSGIISKFSLRNLPLGPRGTFYAGMYGIGGALAAYTATSEFGTDRNVVGFANNIEHALTQPLTLVGLGMVAIGGVVETVDALYQRHQARATHGSEATETPPQPHPIDSNVLNSVVMNPLLLEDLG